MLLTNQWIQAKGKNPRMNTTDFTCKQIFLDQEYLFELIRCCVVDEKLDVPECEKIYIATIKKTNDPNNQWISGTIKSPKLLQRIKSGFMKEYGFDVVLEVCEEGHTLELKITHPLLETTDSIVLEQDSGYRVILLEQRINCSDSRIQSLEQRIDSMDNTIKSIKQGMEKVHLYPITRDMLGPGIILYPDANFSISYCKKYFENLEKCSGGVKPLANPQIIYVANCMSVFYDVKHYFTKEKIVPNENQYIVDGIVLGGGQEVIKNITAYTVFTKRFNDDVIGVIKRSKKCFTVYLAMHQDQKLKIINKQIDGPNNLPIIKTCCTEDDFIDYRYICNLPFPVDSGYYKSNGSPGKDRWILIRDQKLYPYCGDNNHRIFNDYVCIDTMDRCTDPIQLVGPY